MPTPDASVANDGEGTETWLARRERVKQTANNGNGMGMPLTIAVQLLPSPVAQPSGNSPEDHLRKKPGREAVTDLAIIVENGLLETGGRLPTPTAADANGSGGSNRSNVTLTDAVVRTNMGTEPNARLLPTPEAARYDGRKSEKFAKGRATIHDILNNDKWGQYSAAIRRWESVLGRLAPEPTEPTTKGGRRLSAVFVEWLMGLPGGWVTRHGLPRTAELRMLGNGVVTQQALYALQLMRPVGREGETK